jgi:hypothetical protein
VAAVVEQCPANDEQAIERHAPVVGQRRRGRNGPQPASSVRPISVDGNASPNTLAESNFCQVRKVNYLACHKAGNFR